jgi:predicted lipoprotein with Yx(FWY)xxD motif
MRFTTRAALCAALSLAALGSLAAGAPPATMKDGMLVDTKGMTLYTFDRDTAGKSACNGDCAGKWPPLVASAGDEASGDFSIVTRDDGGKQWAYKGKPLYTWSADKAPGDKTGDNFNKVWHVAK